MPEIRRALAVVWVFGTAFAGYSCWRGSDSQPSADIELLTIALPHELLDLDPHSRDNLSAFVILGNVYEPLVSADAGVGLKPMLAERWECPDALTWVFRLRRGVRFHDGHRLNAEDVVFSLRRVLADDELGVRTYVRRLAAAESLDDWTVRLSTRTPFPNLLSKLAQIFIVRAGTDDGTLARATNGTGPFRLTEWRRRERVRMKRHEGYWGGRPLVREALLLQRECAAIPTNELTEGRWSIVATACRDQGARVATDLYRLERSGSLYVKYLGLDVQRDKTPDCDAPTNPFRDLRVRQALSLAIDRDRLVDRLTTYAVPAYQPVPNTVVGFDPNLTAPRVDRPRAAQLLRAAGFPNGFRTRLLVRRLLKEAVPSVQDDLAAVGVRLDVEEVSDDEFSARLDRGSGSLWLSRFGCLGDASDLFDSFFGGPRHYSVHGGYVSPGLARDFELMAESASDNTRRVRLQGLVSQLVHDLPLIPLYSDQDVYLVRRGLAWKPRNDSCIRVADITPEPR